jgi:hypothetical protein
MEAKKAEREEIRSLIEKKRNGEDLTDDEQAKLDDMKSKFKK